MLCFAELSLLLKMLAIISFIYLLFLFSVLHYIADVKTIFIVRFNFPKCFQINHLLSVRF